MLTPSHKGDKMCPPIKCQDSTIAYDEPITILQMLITDNICNEILRVKRIGS